MTIPIVHVPNGKTPGYLAGGVVFDSLSETIMAVLDSGHKPLYLDGPIYSESYAAFVGLRPVKEGV